MSDDRYILEARRYLQKVVDAITDPDGGYERGLDTLAQDAHDCATSGLAEGVIDFDTIVTIGGARAAIGAYRLYATGGKYLQETLRSVKRAITRLNQDLAELARREEIEAKEWDEMMAEQVHHDDQTR